MSAIRSRPIEQLIAGKPIHARIASARPIVGVATDAKRSYPDVERRTVDTHGVQQPGPQRRRFKWRAAHCGWLQKSSYLAADEAFTPTFNFSGFFQPVDNPPAVNDAKAGSAIPVKISSNGNQGLAIFPPGFP